VLGNRVLRHNHKSKQIYKKYGNWPVADQLFFGGKITPGIPCVFFKNKRAGKFEKTVFYKTFTLFFCQFTTVQEFPLVISLLQ
jgi:hypothetical protein